MPPDKKFSDPIAVRVDIFRLSQYDLFVRAFSGRFARGEGELKVWAEIVREGAKTAGVDVEIINEEGKWVQREWPLPALRGGD